MRTTFTSLAVMASSLLVKEVFAAPHGHAHDNLHAKRDYYLDTDNVIVTEEVWVTELADGSYATGAPVAVGTVTIDGSPVLVTEPVAAPTVAPTPTPTPSTSSSSSSSSSSVPAPSSSAAAAVFIEEKPSTTAAPTTSSEAVVVPAPTTLATSVYVAPTTSTSAAPVATSAAASSSSGKRGAAYNDVSLLSAFSGSSEVTWSYNWGSTTPSGVPSSMEYVPMLWGLLSTDTSSWASAVSTAKAAGAKHLLAFNEPDYSGQANLSPAVAATGYLTYMQPYASDFKLVSPAVTNGGGEMGLTWLGNFISACSSCTLDAVAVHWYNGGDAAAFKEYMAKAYTAGGNRPLWVTEFQASGTTEEQAAFLTEVMAWMDETSYIERYAYFMVSDGNLVSGTSLSSLGSTYATST